MYAGALEITEVYEAANNSLLEKHHEAELSIKDHNNKSLKEHLMWPESPARKGNRNSERMPFVLTSEQWQKIQREKMEKKSTAEKQKEERKRKRLEKKEEKENEKKFKKKAMSSNNKTSDVNNNNLNEKKINIISNVKLSEAIENAKKVLFSVEDNNGDVKEATDNDYEIRGNLVNRGLCYSCVKNINSSNYGFNCSMCCRTYHQNCIKKQGLFDILIDNAFTCKPCKLKK